MDIKPCPDCGEPIGAKALSCGCGWGLKRRKGAEAGRDTQCTVIASGTRCRYPVGLFRDGARSGECIFHRNKGPDWAEQIVEMSLEVPYAEALEELKAKASRSIGAEETRSRLRNPPPDDPDRLVIEEPGANG